MIYFVFSLFLLSLVYCDVIPCSDVSSILCRYFPYCRVKEDKCVQDACYASIEKCFSDFVCKKDNFSGVCKWDGQKIDGCTMMQSVHENISNLCDYYHCDVFQLLSPQVSVCVRKLPSQAELCNLTSAVDCKFISFCKLVDGECVEDTCTNFNGSECQSIANCTNAEANNSNSLCISDTRIPFDRCLNYMSLYGALDKSLCESVNCDGHRNIVLNEDYGLTVCVGGENNACHALGTSLCKYNASCYVDKEERKCKVDGCFGDVENKTECFDGCRKQTFTLEEETREFCSTIDRVIDVCTYKGFDSEGECMEGCVKEEIELENKDESVEKQNITVCVPPPPPPPPPPSPPPPSQAISVSVHLSLIAILLIVCILFY